MCLKLIGGTQIQLDCDESSLSMFEYYDKNVCIGIPEGRDITKHGYLG